MFSFDRTTADIECNFIHDCTISIFVEYMKRCHVGFIWTSSLYVGSISALLNCNCTRTHMLFKDSPHLLVTTTTHATARSGLILIFGGTCETVWCWLWTNSLYVVGISALLNSKIDIIHYFV